MDGTLGVVNLMSHFSQKCIKMASLMSHILHDAFLAGAKEACFLNFSRTQLEEYKALGFTPSDQLEVSTYPPLSR